MANTSDEMDNYLFPSWDGSEAADRKVLARFTLTDNALFGIRGSVWWRGETLRPIRMTQLFSNIPVPKAFRAVDKIEYSVATQVIVRWKDGVDVPMEAGAFERCRLPIEEIDPQMSLMQLKTGACPTLDDRNEKPGKFDCLKSKILELRDDQGEDIDWLELNSIPTPQHDPWPDDPAYKDQWGLRAIRAYDAWQTVRRGEQLRPIVAIIDSGIDSNHLDLKDNLPDFDVERLRFMAAAEGKCNSKDGVDPGNNSDEKHSHGTFCAGVVGAVTNNALGVAGVALRPVILPLKCIGEDGTGTVWDAMEAIHQAVRSGANIILAAWGMPQPSRCLYAACRYARDNNVLIVTAAGNGTNDIDLLPFYPASFKLDQDVPCWPLWLDCRDAADEPDESEGDEDRGANKTDENGCQRILFGLDNIVIAGGTVGWGFDSDGLQSEYDPREDKAESSNWGRETVDLGAPARYIRTTRKNHESKVGPNNNLKRDGARLGWANGTSMAASFVAGAAALVKARFPRLNAQEIRRRLIKTAEYVDSLEEYWPYGRRLDLYMAMVAQEDAYGNFVDPKAVKKRSHPRRRRTLFGVLDQPHQHHRAGRDRRTSASSHGAGSQGNGAGSGDEEACTVRLEPDHSSEITLKIQVETGRRDDSDNH